MTEPVPGRPREFESIVDRPVGPHDPHKASKFVFVHPTSENVVNALESIRDEVSQNGKVKLTSAQTQTLRAATKRNAVFDHSTHGPTLLSLAAHVAPEQQRAFWREVLIHLSSPLAAKPQNALRRLLNGGENDTVAARDMMDRYPEDYDIYVQGARGDKGLMFNFVHRYRNAMLGRSENESLGTVSDDNAKIILEEAEKIESALNAIRLKYYH